MLAAIGFFSVIAHAGAGQGDTLNILDFGAAGDAASDTAALQSALAAARKTPGSTIDLPAGLYHFTPPGAAGFIVPTRTTLRGAGMGRTRIAWNDAHGTVLFASAVADGVRPADIAVRDLTVTGTSGLPENAGLPGGYPLLFRDVDGLTIDHVTSEYSRAMGIVARASTDVSVTGSIVRYSFSDGISLTGDTGITISGNVVEHGEDDCISAHSDIGDPSGVHRDLVISGNRCFDTQGIKVLAARQAVITGNTLDAVRAQGIMVRSCGPGAGDCSGGREGLAAALSIVISSNVISNVIDRRHVDNANQGNPGISISGASARAGDLGAIPGEADPRTGTVIDPYPAMLANSHAPGTATPGSHGVIVTGNVIARTLPASDGSDPRFTSWSSFGFGRMWTKRGWADPKLSEADLEGDGIEIFGGVVRDVLISGNIIRGMASGLSLGHAEHLDDIMFRGNQVIDCARWGVVVNTKAALSVQVEDNVFDLDPFNRSRNRGPHGTWLKPAGPTGIQQQDGAGMLVRRNVFRNLARLGSGAMQGGGYWWDDNVIEADPVGYGFDPRNEGVGEVLSDGNSRLVQIGSDPADAQHFGRILSVPSFVATTRPTAGAWLPGAFVRAERPAVSAGRVLLGWLRLTIGAANGPADWTDVYGSAK